MLSYEVDSGRAGVPGTETFAIIKGVSSCSVVRLCILHGEFNKRFLGTEQSHMYYISSLSFFAKVLGQNLELVRLECASVSHCFASHSSGPVKFTHHSWNTNGKALCEA